LSQFVSAAIEAATIILGQLNLVDKQWAGFKPSCV
jgi:hypothetical protein